MDLTQAIRVAEKIRPWINRMPELVAALDALLDLARERAPKATADPKSSAFMAKWDEFWGDMFGMPPEDEMPPAPAKATEPSPVEIITADKVPDLPPGSIYVPCSSTGVPEGAPQVYHSGMKPGGWVWYRVLYRTEPKAEAKPAPKVGDLVAWADLDRVPVGTVVAWVTGDGERGIVRSSGGAHDVAWSDAKLRGGGTVKVVLLPEGDKNGAE